MKEKKKLKKWQIVLIVILAIGVIGAIGGSGEEKEKKADDPKTEEKEKSNKKEEPVAKKYVIGDLVKVGDVEYTVTAINSTDTIGDQYINTKAKNMFLVVDVTIKNNGNKALTVADSFFKLKNGEKEYNSDSGTAVYLGDQSIIFTEVNPDASLSGKVVFDISQDTINTPELQLQVQTGVFGTEKELINLH